MVSWKETEPMEQETVFQKILDGRIAADKVRETDTVLAFLDNRPINKGHVLVIPKTPVRDITDLTDQDAADLMREIVRVAAAVRKATGAPAMNISANNGAEAGQEVFHLHFHIIPRFNKEEFPKIPRKQYESDEERARCARDIAEAIGEA